LRFIQALQPFKLARADTVTKVGGSPSVGLTASTSKLFDERWVNWGQHFFNYFGQFTILTREKNYVTMENQHFLSKRERSAQSRMGYFLRIAAVFLYFNLFLTLPRPSSGARGAPQTGLTTLSFFVTLQLRSMSLLSREMRSRELTAG